MVSTYSTYDDSTAAILEALIFNPFNPKVKKYILPTFSREMYKWGSENWYENHLSIWVSYEKPILHTVWCNMTGEARGEIWTWSLLGVKVLKGNWGLKKRLMWSPSKFHHGGPHITHSKQNFSSEFSKIGARLEFESFESYDEKAVCWALSFLYWIKPGYGPRPYTHLFPTAIPNPNPNLTLTQTLT